jgi:hypothetical protein
LTASNASFTVAYVDGPVVPAVAVTDTWAAAPAPTSNEASSRDVIVARRTLFEFRDSPAVCRTLPPRSLGPSNPTFNGKSQSAAKDEGDYRAGLAVGRKARVTNDARYRAGEDPSNRRISTTARPKGRRRR